MLEHKDLKVDTRLEAGVPPAERAIILTVTWQAGAIILTQVAFRQGKIR